LGNTFRLFSGIIRLSSVVVTTCSTEDKGHFFARSDEKNAEQIEH
jgi:hypothetical protein